MRAAILCWITACLSLSAGTLTFDQTMKEVVAAADAKTVTADFEFKNASGEEVTIEKYDAACTCISAQIKGAKLSYKPGESGLIRAAFDMSQFSGTADKSIAVWLKGDPEHKPSIMLTARVTIPVLVEVLPQSLFWDLGSPVASKTVTVTMKHTEPIKVTAVSGADGRFKQELKVIEEGKKYEVVITPASTDKVGMGVIHIETDCAVARHRTHRIFTVIRKPLAKTGEAKTTP